MRWSELGRQSAGLICGAAFTLFAGLPPQSLLRAFIFWYPLRVTIEFFPIITVGARMRILLLRVRVDGLVVAVLAAARVVLLARRPRLAVAAASRGA